MHNNNNNNRNNNLNNNSTEIILKNSILNKNNPQCAINRITIVKLRK